MDLKCALVHIILTNQSAVGQKQLSSRAYRDVMMSKSHGTTIPWYQREQSENDDTNCGSHFLLPCFTADEYKYTFFLEELFFEIIVCQQDVNIVTSLLSLHKNEKNPVSAFYYIVKIRIVFFFFLATSPFLRPQHDF